MAGCSIFPVIDLPATGRSIEQRRKAAGLSVRDVQAYFGFEYPQAVYKWQHGECLPSVDNLLALSRLLGTPMEDLLVYEDQEVPYFLGKRNSVCVIRRFFVYNTVTALLWKLCYTYYRKIRD